MPKKSMTVAILLLLFLVSPSLAAPNLMVEYNGGDWFVGLESEQTKGKLLGFYGYQADYSTLMLGINSNSQNHQLFGLGSIGRETYLGNISYHLGIQGGYLNEFNLELVGAIRTTQKDLTYGLDAELTILKPSISVQPLLAWSNNIGTLQAQLGLGSHPAYLRLGFDTKLDPFGEFNVFALYNTQHEYEYGISLLFDQALSISGSLNNNQDLLLALSYRFPI